MTEVSRPPGNPAPSTGPGRRLTRMLGRDPHQSHRAATPLELLFDLTFVVAFSFAATGVSHSFAEGHWSSGLLGFGFSTFAVIWAWINFTWFASAFDTDDWAFRLATLVQMIGVVVAALGIPALFASLDSHAPPDIRVLVLGYVVMRVAMVFQWVRAGRQSPAFRRACYTYAAAIAVAQIGWIGLAVAGLPFGPGVVAWVVLLAVELAGPVVAERRVQTPWHAHHVAERYGLLAIIALGEGIVGAAVSLSATVEAVGWTWQTALVGMAGVGLTFGMWWVYFLMPSAEVLHRRRDKNWVWGYGHYVVFGSIAAVGAGLHVAAYYIEHTAHISATATVLTVVVPVGLYVLSVLALEAYLRGRLDSLHLKLVLGAGVLLVLPVALAAAHVPVAVCLVVLTLAPAVVVVGYERADRAVPASVPSG